MRLTPTLAARFGRPAAALLAAAALAVISGCQSGGAPVTNDTMGGGNNTASGGGPAMTGGSGGGNGNGGDMSAKGGSAGMYDTTQYFPLGVKSGEVLRLDAMGPSSVRLNKEASFQIKITNLTDNAVHNIMLMSTNPDGFQVTGANGSTTQPAEKGMGYAVGDLDAKQSKTVTITGMATKVGSVDTCYSVTYNPPTLCTMVQVTNPAIALAVQAPADTDICQPVTYTYTVTNTGTGTAHNVMLMETLPDGLMTTDGKQAVNANLGDIPQGENRVVKVDLKASKTGSFTGQATASSDGDAAQPAPTVTAVHAPVLAVAVTGGQPVYVGQNATVQIMVTNKGDAAAKDAKLQIGHPQGGMGNVTAEGVDSSGMVALGDLAPNASKTVTATVSSTQGGNATVVANATATCATAVSGQADTMFNTIPALLLETVDEHDPVTVGQNVVYDVKVTNQGSGPDNNVAVKAIIPDGETYVSTDGPTQPAVDGSNLTFPTIPVLAPKESATWKVSVKAAKAADVQFKTSASCDGTAPAEKTEPTKLTPQ